MELVRIESRSCLMLRGLPVDLFVGRSPRAGPAGPTRRLDLATSTTPFRRIRASAWGEEGVPRSVCEVWFSLLFGDEGRKRYR